MSDHLFSIAGKTAVVTGGSRGIGLMIARGFVRAGARVIVSSRKADVCAAVAEELSTEGRCEGVPADMSHDAGAEGLAAAVRERTGDRLDVLVNNAGATWGAPLEAYPESAFDKLWAVNVKAVFTNTYDPEALHGWGNNSFFIMAERASFARMRIQACHC